MNEERIKEVFSDEAFVKELLSKETPEEVQAMLAEKDIDLTIDEIVKLRELIIKKLQKAQSGEEELGDEDLEDVAGGSGLAVLVAGTLSLLIVPALFAGLMYGASEVNERTRGRW